MSASPLGKFTRLRELAEDWEAVVTQYPQVQRLQDRALKARLVLDEIQDALAPAAYEEVGRNPWPIDPAVEDRRKLATVQALIDRYFAS